MRAVVLCFLVIAMSQTAAFAGAGHDAGYKWAEEKGITNPSDCSGNSNSFIEGCQGYAEEQQQKEQEENQQ